MLKHNSRLSNNQSGFSLVEILVGVAMLGGLSLAVINMTKQQAKLSTKSTIDGDVSEISARILNALNSPTYCETNFRTKPTGTNQPLTTLAVIGKVISSQTSGSAWVAGSAGNITDRLRMNTATYSVGDITPAVPGQRSLAALALTVQFETTALENARKNITKTFSATVLVDGTTTIIGCPKSWNSTLRPGGL